MWRALAMANAIHRMVDAMQPVAAQSRVMIPPVRPVTMEDLPGDRVH